MRNQLQNPWQTDLFAYQWYLVCDKPTDAELDVYRDNSLKLQSTSRHVSPLGHIFHESEPANHCFYSLMPGVKLRSSKYAILKPVFWSERGSSLRSQHANYYTNKVVWTKSKLYTTYVINILTSYMYLYRFSLSNRWKILQLNSLEWCIPLKQLENEI